MQRNMWECIEDEVGMYVETGTNVGREKREYREEEVGCVDKQIGTY